MALPGRALSMAELNSAMKQIKRESTVYRWPEGEDRKKLAEAVKNKEQSVELDGQNFSIRYKTHFPDAVYVRPAGKQFVPCGYFNIGKLVSGG
jgi:cell division protein YceG involved in septum cleavage